MASGEKGNQDMTGYAPNQSPTASLYTARPYPGDGVVRTTAARILARGLRKHAPHLTERTLRMADVGCGTGEQTCGLARRFPSASVLGIDINPPSIALARKLAEGSNVHIQQADIGTSLRAQLEAAGVMPSEGFDAVTSLGVLHHLADPAAGFREVRSIIRADGLFACFMYSELGRWRDRAVDAVLSAAVASGEIGSRTALLRALRLSDDFSAWGFLRRLRQRLAFGPPISVVELARVALSRNRDVHLADEFSNPCEHLYRFAGLRKLFEASGWSLVALAEQGGLPTTPEEHTSDPAAQAVLRTLPADVLYDYFALFYQVYGFYFFLRPA